MKILFGLNTLKKPGRFFIFPAGKRKDLSKTWIRNIKPTGKPLNRVFTLVLNSTYSLYITTSTPGKRYTKNSGTFSRIYPDQPDLFTQCREKYLTIASTSAKFNVKMICPNCNQQLKITRVKTGIIYSCQFCQGKLISLAILRKECVDNNFINEIWNLSFSSNRNIKNCPICKSKMSSIDVKAENNQQLNLDVCKRCAMIWFDQSEYDLIPASDKNTTQIITDPSLKQMIQEIEIQKVRDKINYDSKQAKLKSSDIDNKVKYIPLLLGLPINVEKDYEKKPWVTWSISLSLLIIFILSLLDYNEIISNFGFIPIDFDKYYFLTFMSSFFLHGNLIHLIGNLYFLMLFGPAVEEYLGKMIFSILIILSHFFGVLLYFLMNINSTLPVIGASAGISGVLGLYIIKYPLKKMGLFFLFKLVSLPVIAYFFLWVAFQIIYIVLSRHGIMKIAALAHLGGVIIGITFGIFYRILGTD